MTRTMASHVDDGGGGDGYGDDIPAQRSCVLVPPGIAFARLIIPNIGHWASLRLNKGLDF